MTRKIRVSLAAGAMVLAGVILPASAANADDLGGWSEGAGSYVLGVDSADSAASGGAIRIASSVNHRGKAETKTIKGTTNKRSHGWTTWSGVRHYTTARMESTFGSTVYNTSGRQWGTGSTEAISPWRAFVPDHDLGKAKTYYGH